MAPDMEVFLLSDKPFPVHIPVRVCFCCAWWQAARWLGMVLTSLAASLTLTPPLTSSWVSFNFVAFNTQKLSIILPGQQLSLLWDGDEQVNVHYVDHFVVFEVSFDGFFIFINNSSGSPKKSMNISEWFESF